MIIIDNKYTTNLKLCIILKNGKFQIVDDVKKATHYLTDEYELYPIDTPYESISTSRISKIILDDDAIPDDYSEQLERFGVDV